MDENECAGVLQQHKCMWHAVCMCVYATLQTAAHWNGWPDRYGVHKFGRSINSSLYRFITATQCARTNVCVYVCCMLHANGGRFNALPYKHQLWSPHNTLVQKVFIRNCLYLGIYVCMQQCAIQATTSNNFQDFHFHLLAAKLLLRCTVAIAVTIYCCWCCCSNLLLLQLQYLQSLIVIIALLVLPYCFYCFVFQVLLLLFHLLLSLLKFLLLLLRLFHLPDYNMQPTAINVIEMH